jgi:hypothetical protein
MDNPKIMDGLNMMYQQYQPRQQYQPNQLNQPQQPHQQQQPQQPHQQQSVCNTNCTICPVVISDGKEYMAWADISEFNKSRRFTGNMNINLDYVKNVLNDSNSY